MQMLVTFVIHFLIFFSLTCLSDSSHEGQNQERVVKQVDLRELFSFVFNVIHHSQPMRELLSPIYIPIEFETAPGPDAIRIEGMEVNGLDKLTFQGTPKLVYTSYKNALFHSSINIKFVEFTLDYKFGRLPPGSVTGHVNQVVIEITLEVPLGGGGTPRATHFKVVEFEGYTLTTGDPLILPIAGSPLLAEALIGQVGSQGTEAINQILSKLELPEVPEAKKQEL